MITRHIADLLYQHECVIVPGLGGFIKAFNPAWILHTSHEFYPPSGSIAFNGGLSVNDGVLANYIASVENISYRDALAELKQWADSCLDALKKDEKVELEGIGILFLNSSGKTEFTPSKQINFNADSFGLPVFYAKAVNNELFVLPEIQPSKSTYRYTSLRRFVPETLKWAAVLAPFIAFAFWGSINNNIIDNYVHNYTGMYSWVRSTPGKTAPVKIATYPGRAKEAPVEVVQSPAGLLAGENISFNPGEISHAALAKNNLTIANTTASVAVSQIVSESPTQDYYIIGGAFRDHNNALKLISMLREQGYPASVVDTTSGGLYVVSLKGFDNYKDATIQLDEIKKTGFSSSWILKKQRV
jgi:nucleoid DNA-binding protein